MSSVTWLELPRRRPSLKRTWHISRLPSQRHLRLAGCGGQAARSQLSASGCTGGSATAVRVAGCDLRPSSTASSTRRTRLFDLDASMFTIPAQGYDRYVESSASMRVKAAALVQAVAARAPR